MSADEREVAGLLATERALHVMWLTNLVLLVAFRRWRHLFVWFGVVLVVVNVAAVTATTLQRPRPFEVEIVGELPDYRAAEVVPEIGFGAERSDDNDWLGLSITVEVDGALGDRLERLAVELRTRRDPHLVDGIGQDENLDSLGAERFHVRRVHDLLTRFAGHVVDRVLTALHPADVVGECGQFVLGVGGRERRGLEERLAVVRIVDQTFLEHYFPDWHGLPVFMNMLQYVWFAMPELWRWQDVKILHFQYEKPWQDPHPKAAELAPLIALWRAYAGDGPVPQPADLPRPARPALTAP